MSSSEDEERAKKRKKKKNYNNKKEDDYDLLPEGSFRYNQIMAKVPVTLEIDHVIKKDLTGKTNISFSDADYHTIKLKMPLSYKAIIDNIITEHLSGNPLLDGNEYEHLTLPTGVFFGWQESRKNR